MKTTFLLASLALTFLFHHTLLYCTTSGFPEGSGQVVHLPPPAPSPKRGEPALNARLVPNPRENPKWCSIYGSAIDLNEAAQKGLVAFSVSGSGGHSGECIKVKLENTSRKKLEIRIPAGQIFEPGDSSLQNLMVTKEEIFLVEKGKTRIGRLYGLCVEATDGSPGEHSVFGLGKMAAGNLLKLAQHLSENNLHKNPYAQFAVWSVSDNERLEEIGDPKLTKFVADLLGKPMPEYHIKNRQPRDRLLPGQPANYREAFAMNGLFYYTLENEKIVNFELYNEEGELLHAFFENRRQKRGYHKFRFEFEIRNLPKGKYFAKLTSGGEVIKELGVEF
ncbi:MAG TPA: hypothetical protein ENJ95_03620 [Bacteroidetes bacterium]|nr:hypothetical protein [Bacteroidota bacterium]